MIHEIPDREEFALYEVLRHPVFSWEFINNVDKLDYEEEFVYTHYQQEFVCDFSDSVSFCCARAVGKTESISGKINWALINNIYPDDYILYTVPNKAHLEPVWARLTRYFRTNSVLKSFVYPQKGINGSTNTINLLNGAILICRIAGTTGDGRNVIGLHCPLQILDEGGYYPWGTWLELIPTLNTWTPGMQLMISGVPTGLRENNVLYMADMQNDDFTKHRIPAHRNPRYTDEDEQRSIELYGEPESDNYIHFVLGRHGRPTFAIFDRSLMDVRGYPVYKIVLNGIDLGNQLADYYERLSLLPKQENKLAKIIFGIDLGYTDPTAIVILEETKDGQFKFHARIKLNKVPYPVQTKIIDYLDSKFNPVLLGIDEGHAGIGEVQKLRLDPIYRHKNYKDRLVPISFTSNTIIGQDEDGKDIKEKTRPYSVSVLQQMVNEHKLSFSSTDLDMITELERMVYIRTAAGNRVYKTLTPKGGKKGEDHFTAALLCASMAWFLHNESISYGRQNKLKISGGFNVL